MTAHIISAWNTRLEKQLFNDRLFCRRIGEAVPISFEQHPPAIKEVLSIKVCVCAHWGDRRVLMALRVRVRVLLETVFSCGSLWCCCLGWWWATVMLLVFIPKPLLLV